MTTATNRPEEPIMWPDLRRKLEEGQGVYETSMGTLRNLEGGKRVDAVRRKVGDRLREYGIGHIPRDLPKHQDAQVILYDKRSETAEVIYAIQSDRPGPSLASILRKLNAPRERVVPADMATGALDEALTMITQLRVSMDKAQRK